MSFEGGRGRVRVLFLFTVLIVITQFIIASTFSEPYPALIFPGFSSVPIEKDVYTSKKANLFAITEDGEVIPVNRKDLFNNLENTPSYVLMLRLFSQNSTLFDSTTHSSARLHIGTYTYSITKKRNHTQHQLDEFYVWLEKRLSEITGREDISKFKIQWIRLFRHIETNEKSMSVDTTFTLSFKD
jgi:hypothetical protein